VRQQHEISGEQADAAEFEPPAIEWLGSWDELTAAAGPGGFDAIVGNFISG
jgi:hypothetical protein